MSSNKTVTVLTPNGRRQNVKATPNTTILQILEEVCKKQGFESEEYDLRHHNHILDTTATMRFSGLPNNAQLEMSVAVKTRQESTVVLGLHLESGDRVMGDFMPTASLWDVIKKLCPEEADPDANPVIIYMRREVSGEKHLTSTTLRCLGLTGGRALLRLVHGTPEQLHHQANVSGPLQRPSIADVTKETKVDTFPIPSTSSAAQSFSELTASRDDQPNTSTPDARVTTAFSQPCDSPMEVDEPASETVATSQTDSYLSNENAPTRVSTDNSEEARREADSKPEGEIVLLGERNAIVFSLEMAQSVPCEDLPEDFYDLTAEDARALYRDIRRARAELDDAPLVTSALRELEVSKRVLTQLNSYKRAVLRVQFPDRTVLQGTFLPLETVSIVEQFVSEYLEDQTMLFHLYTTPPKAVLSSDARLVEVNCVPSALVHFGLDVAQPDTGKYLRAELLTRLTSPSAAALVAHQSRGLLRSALQSSSSSGMDLGPSTSVIDPGPSTSGTDPGPSTSSNNGNRPPRPDYGPSSKVPKWFKPPMK